MAKGRSRSLRLYCVCGQRMKVSTTMYGRPGKCVACRQKIRIPREDELPPDVTELYLKDHPEFLRKSRSRATEPVLASRPKPSRIKKQKSAPPLSPENAAPASKAEKAAVLKYPLDTLEPLRMLCSLDFLVQRRLAFLEKHPGEGGAGLDEPALREQQARIAKSREELEQDLRQRLVETEIELSRTEERVASLTVECRVGEVDFLKHHEQLEKLRWRRDLLERRKRNLTGWIEVNDPYMAGGLADVGPETAPETFQRVTLPTDPDEPQLLMQTHVDALRTALEERETAERRLKFAREEAAKTHAKPGRDHAAQEAKAIKRRADATVQFTRDRLERLRDDYGDDLRALDAQIERLQVLTDARDVEPGVLAMREAVLNGAKSGLLRSRDVLNRALSANSAREVPSVRQTLRERPIGEDLPWENADVWTAWAGAILLLLSLVAPLAPGQTTLSVVRGAGAQALSITLFAAPLFGAILAAAAGFIPKTALRGLVFAALASITALTGIGVFHNLGYSPGALGVTAMKAGNVWLNPAPALYLFGALALGVAAGLAVLRRPWGIVTLAASAGIVVVGGAIVLTDVAGLASPRVDIEDLMIEPGPATSSDMYKCAISVRNMGARVVLLSADESREAGFRFELTEKQEDQTWRSLGKPMQAVLDSAGSDDATLRSREGRYFLMQGDRAVLWYWAKAGSYRARVLGPNHEVYAARAFPVPGDATMTAPPESTTAPATPSSAPVAGPANTNAAAVSSNAPDGMPLEAELNAVLASEARQPKFSITVYLPSGENFESVLGMNNAVYGAWRVREYNPTEQTITLATDDNRIVILRKGVRVKLQ